MKTAHCLILLLSAILILTCDIQALIPIQTISLRIGLPTPRLNASGLWTIRWYTSRGDLRCITAQGNEEVIELERGEFTPILLEFRYEDTGSRLMPDNLIPVHGALFPEDIFEDSPGTWKIKPTVLGGTCAHLAQGVIEGAREGKGTGMTIASLFNWERFRQTLLTLETPEYLDYQRIMEAILSGSVRFYDIKMKPLTAVRLVLPNTHIKAGTVFSRPGDGKEAFIWPESAEVSVMAPEGISYFVADCGAICVSVLDRRLICAYFLPY